MEKKSRILIVGGTGKLGFEIAKASLRSSHPTFALIRDESFTDLHKSHKLQTLSDSGATLLKGSLEDETRLIEAIKQVDVVICAVSSKQVLLQKLLISAIKQAGCIKKFIPSEFGVDPCKTRISGLDHNFYARKAEIRCLVEAEGIPYTYICCNFFMSYLLPSIVQPGLKSPPRDKIKIFGDKNAKGVFMKESDVASFTISAVDDPRTLNKVLHLRPRGNVYSMNELVEIWESKIGKKLEKIYVPEEELLKKIEETPYPDNMDMVFIYSAFVKGDHTYFDIESSGGVDGTKLYPHLKYTTINSCTFLWYALFHLFLSFCNYPHLHLHANATWLAEQSDVGVFSQVLHFSLVGLFFAYKAMVHHGKIIKAADKLKASRDRQTERVKELELRLGTLKGKVVEAEKKLQTMDSVLKSSSQEITILNEEKKQLSAALTASKESLADEVKAAKEEGCNEATVVYEVQFAKLGNMLFEDDWTFALQVTNVSMESKLRKNIPYPCPDAVEKPSGETAEGAGIENLPTVE